MKFSVITPSGSQQDEIRLREAVQRTLGLDAQGLPWRVERLFPESIDVPELAVFFRVSGQIASTARVQTTPNISQVIAARIEAATSFHVEIDEPAGEWNLSPDVYDANLVGHAKAFADLRLPEAALPDWPLKRLGLDRAWELEPPQSGLRLGEGISIGSPDTGYRNHHITGLSHFDLVRDRDILNGDDDALDPLRWFPGTNPGHGTGVGSCMAARKVADLQGAAPAALVVPIRSVVRVVLFSATDVASAIDHARRAGTQVISMSLGSLGLLPLQAVINQSLKEGKIVIAAGGQTIPIVPEPASFEGVIGVGASDAVDRPWVETTPGHHLAWCAPGHEVWIPKFQIGPFTSDETLGQGSGTSYSTAFTAGIAALWLAFHGPERLRERYGSKLAKAFRAIGTASCLRPPDWDVARHGAGIIQADRVLSAKLPPVDVL